MRQCETFTVPQATSTVWRLGVSSPGKMGKLDLQDLLEAKAMLELMVKMVKSDASDVLSVLAVHVPIQLAEWYGEKMCFVKYHVSEDQSIVVRMTGGLQMLHNVSAYNEPIWYFDAQFV